jgi:hypothetical protein
LGKLTRSRLDALFDDCVIEILFSAVNIFPYDCVKEFLLSAENITRIIASWNSCFPRRTNFFLLLRHRNHVFCGEHSLSYDCVKEILFSAVNIFPYNWVMEFLFFAENIFFPMTASWKSFFARKTYFPLLLRHRNHVFLRRT